MIKKLFTENFLEDLRRTYITSGISMPFDEYIKLISIIPITTFSCFVPVIFIIHYVILRAQLIPTLLISILLSALIGATTFALLIYYPRIRSSSRRYGIESTLVFTVSLITTLSTIGMNLERIIETVLEVEDNKYIKEELLLLLRDMKLLGLDALTALKNASMRTPSKVMKDVFQGIRESIISIGSPVEFLRFMVTSMIENRKKLLREITSGLSILSEIYVTLTVITPIALVVMMILMSVMGGTIFGIDPLSLIVIVTLLLVPIGSLAVLIIIDGWLSRV
ncbi:MAG: hypothetical protein DRN53_07880 [Thermoprotei archaeon]|nr:MAG: hypothetical protein DRN53_07880 [Thermoprotei archaeon]